MTVFQGMLTNSSKSQSASKEWERCLMLCPKCTHKPTAMEINKVVVLKGGSEDKYWVKCPLCTHKETVTYTKAYPSSEPTKEVAEKAPFKESVVTTNNNAPIEVAKEERAIDKCLYKLPNGNHVVNGICVKKHKGRFGEEDSYNIGRDCYRTKEGRIPPELLKVFTA